MEQKLCDTAQIHVYPTEKAARAESQTRVQDINGNGFEERKPLISQAVLDLLKNEGLSDDQAMVIICWCKWRLGMGGLNHQFKSK